MFSLILDSTHHDLGKHNTKVSMLDLEYMLHYDLWIGEIFLHLAISLPKLSALAFYARVFDIRRTQNKAWKWTVVATIVFTILWTIAFLVFTIMQCIPVKKYWSPLSHGGHCVDQAAFFVPASITDAILDVV